MAARPSRPSASNTVLSRPYRLLYAYCVHTVIMATGVMTVGMAIGKYAFIVILALAVILLAGFLYAKTSHGSAVFSRLFSRFFLTRKLSAKIASSRFASVMSMMLSSGYSTDEALELVPGVLSNDLVAEKIAACRKELSEGVSFAEAVDKAELFPGVYGQMVSVGSKTGNLDSVMKKLAEVYDDEVDRSISRVVSVIEPTLVGILSVVIGAILLSVMLPLMGIMSSIG